MLKKIQDYLADTSGATAVEYGFIVASIGVPMMIGAFMFGGEMASMFEIFSTYLDGHLGVAS